MKPIELLVRCYANKDGDQWQAFCIDLCLSAQGDTLADAQGKLHLMIADYVTEALTIDREHAEYLLNRKAPIKQIATYHYYKILHSIGRLKSELHTLFKETIPLVPQNYAH
ncbi:MAG: hypothetical protein H6936_01270 [Burkholderiales bacterium]|nr:hypothetical protein [Burkholderiales bacterium]